MDSIANMMTSLTNAQRVRKERVAIPYSSFKERLAQFLQHKDVIAKIRVQEGIKAKLILTLKYADGQGRVAQVRRISKPGYRQYVNHEELPYMGGRKGFYIISTSQGLMDEERARREKLGGEMICEIWEG